MPKPASTRPAYKMLTCIYLCRTLLFFAPYADFSKKNNCCRLANATIHKKKVWSRSFIWMEVLVNLESNKQYPTLVQHGAETHIPIQVMSVVVYPQQIEFSRFLFEVKSKHFHQYTPLARQDKGKKIFRNWRHPSGPCCANFAKHAFGYYLRRDADIIKKPEPSKAPASLAARWGYLKVILYLWQW